MIFSELDSSVQHSCWVWEIVFHWFNLRWSNVQFFLRSQDWWMHFLLHGADWQLKTSWNTVNIYQHCGCKMKGGQNWYYWWIIWFGCIIYFFCCFLHSRGLCCRFLGLILWIFLSSGLTISSLTSWRVFSQRLSGRDGTIMSDRWKLDRDIWGMIWNLGGKRGGR